MSERDVVRGLKRLFGTPAAGRVATLGIGDDAAVLRALGPRAVWTVDVAVEGVHFERRFFPLPDIAARAFHAAVSDLAAMGARPVAALSSLVVPPRYSERDVLELARGQRRAARELACPVVGGNLSRGGELSITTTALGVATTPLTRSGARPGDDLWLMGDVGLAGAGLRLLTAPKGARLTAPERRARERAIAAFQRPRARLRDGLVLARCAHAAMDVSDGLAGDALHLAEASGVRIVVEAAALGRALAPELAVVATLVGLDALALALAGGEDYALLAAGPPARRPRGARRIGRVVKGRGVMLEDSEGRLGRVPLGFDHFAKRS